MNKRDPARNKYVLFWARRLHGTVNLKSKEDFQAFVRAATQLSKTSVNSTGTKKDDEQSSDESEYETCDEGDDDDAPGIRVNLFQFQNDLEELPPEVFGYLLEFIDKESLLQLIQVSRACYNLANNEMNVAKTARILGPQYIVFKRLIHLIRSEDDCTRDLFYAILNAKWVEGMDKFLEIKCGDDRDALKHELSFIALSSSNRDGLVMTKYAIERLQQDTLIDEWGIYELEAAFTLACRFGFYDIVTYIMSAVGFTLRDVFGVDVQYGYPAISSVNDKSLPVLADLCYKGNVSMVNLFFSTMNYSLSNLFVENVSNINDSSIWPKTIFAFAIDGGFPDIVRILCSYEASASEDDPYHGIMGSVFKNALNRACRNGRLDCVKVLVEEFNHADKIDSDTFKAAINSGMGSDNVSVISYLTGKRKRT